MFNTLKAAAIGAVMALGMGGASIAQELKFFTIGTGLVVWMA